jgi:hypothetical protein
LTRIATSLAIISAGTLRVTAASWRCLCPDAALALTSASIVRGLLTSSNRTRIATLGRATTLRLFTLTFFWALPASAQTDNPSGNGFLRECKGFLGSHEHFGTGVCAGAVIKLSSPSRARRIALDRGCGPDADVDVCALGHRDAAEGRTLRRPMVAELVGACTRRNSSTAVSINSGFLRSSRMASGLGSGNQRHCR